MSTTYTIASTDGDTVIVIGDNSTSGNLTGVSNHDTDLLLYGRGTFNWGSGIEQNLIRLTENWASPALNPTADVNDQVPMTYGSTPNKGIVIPMQGQTWFNKSNNRLYTCVTANGVFPKVWNVDAEFRYLSTTEIANQELNGKLRISNSTGQPDLYIYSNTPTFGIGAGPIDTNTGLPTDLGASSYITFEANKGTEASPARVRTAYIAALHKDDDMLRIAVSDRLAANSYGSATNRIDLKQDRTEIVHDIVHIGASQLSYSIGLSALTTRGWVEDYIGGAVTNVGDSQYLKLTGGTITGAVNQTVGANTININNGSIQIEASSPTVTLRSLANDAGQPSFNLADSDITKVSLKMIQGNYSGNAGPRVLADNVDTLVIEKYNSGFNTTQAMIFYDDYIQTHGTTGHLRTPATIMQGEAGYSALYQLTVGKAYDTFCQLNQDITVDDINANSLTINNGSSPANIVVQSQDNASITIDASNNLDTINPVLIFRARGGQRGNLRINADTGGDDSLSLVKMNGGAEPNSINVYDDRTTTEQRIELGGIGDSPSNGSIILKGKDDVTTGATSDYSGAFTTEDYIGLIFKRANGATVASILSNNTDELVFRSPTNGTVAEIEAPIMTMTDHELILENMRLRANSGSSLERGDYNSQLSTSSNYYAQERQVAEVTDRRWQEGEIGYKTLLVDINGNATGYYKHTSFTSDPTTSAYEGYFAEPVEFNFNNTYASSFSQEFDAVDGKVHRCEVHFTIPYAMIVGSGTGTVGGSTPVYLTYETGPFLGTPSNASIGNFQKIEVGRLHSPGQVDLYGSFSGMFLVPMNPGDKVQIRLDDAWGRVSAFNNEYNRVVFGTMQFKARIV